MKQSAAAIFRPGLNRFGNFSNSCRGTEDRAKSIANYEIWKPVAGYPATDTPVLDNLEFATNGHSFASFGLPFATITQSHNSHATRYGSGYAHFESPQFRQVKHPSIITTAAVLHFMHSWAPSGKLDSANASSWLWACSNSKRFCSMKRF